MMNPYLLYLKSLAAPKPQPQPAPQSPPGRASHVGVRLVTLTHRAAPATGMSIRLYRAS